MNHKKLILVGAISAFVAILTTVLGVTGTVIGSVISSVLYNMLSEALEKPVEEATFSHNFEWEVAYIFPLAVIAMIQLLLILSFLSEWGFLPYGFLNAFLMLQDFANNNLYRILGLAMLVISVYPIFLKPDIIKKSHGVIIALVGFIFLARGFVDAGNAITNAYDVIFIYFDFPIAIIALVMIIYAIVQILKSARQSEKEFKAIKKEIHEEKFSKPHAHHSKKHEDFDYEHKSKSIRVSSHKNTDKSNVHFNTHVGEKHSEGGINKSSSNIHFESNDLLDDYKK